MSSTAESSTAYAATTRPVPALVDPEWLAGHLEDPDVAVIEIDEDRESYHRSHLPGAIGLDWATDLRDPTRRTFVGRRQFEALMDASGIADTDHVVLYGDNHNWFAAYGYWLFTVYRHARVSLLDGGRKAWEEQGRPLTSRATHVVPTSGYVAGAPDEAVRARRSQVLSDAVAPATGVALVDVRSAAEYRGETTAPPHLPEESSVMAGHIPGAVNVRWAEAVDPRSGCFRPVEELREVYRSAGLRPDDPVITYCRIGERAAHTWFVLREILGYSDVRTYDGSWTEYGSLIDVPIGR